MFEFGEEALELLWQIAQQCAGACDPQDRFRKEAVVGGRAPGIANLPRQRRFDPSPIAHFAELSASRAQL
jgi:hypothetical protein